MKAYLLFLFLLLVSCSETPPSMPSYEESLVLENEVYIAPAPPSPAEQKKRHLQQTEKAIYACRELKPSLNILFNCGKNSVHLQQWVINYERKGMQFTQSQENAQEYFFFAYNNGKIAYIRYEKEGWQHQHSHKQRQIFFVRNNRIQRQLSAQSFEDVEKINSILDSQQKENQEIDTLLYQYLIEKEDFFSTIKRESTLKNLFCKHD